MFWLFFKCLLLARQDALIFYTCPFLATVSSWAFVSYSDLLFITYNQIQVTTTYIQLSPSNQNYIYLSLFQENVTLIKEINDLRRELKIARTQVHDLETALGVMRKSQGLPVGDGVSNEADKMIKTEDLVQLEKIIDIQKGEIRKLRVQIKDIENRGLSRPPSGGKLPPVPVI